MKKQAVLFCLLLLTGCFSESSSDAEETFEYWAGTTSPEEVELINGQYYQSPHFTLEYELFLEFKTTEKWWSEFIKTNRLELDRQNEDWKTSTALPDWFVLGNSFLIYSKNNQFDRSRYFYDSEGGVCYIYETVGM